MKSLDGLKSRTGREIPSWRSHLGKKPQLRTLVAFAVVAAAGVLVRWSLQPDRAHTPPSAAQSSIAALRKQADVIRIAYGHLRQRGCAEHEISFANGALEGHNNAIARPDHTCDIFAAQGGAVPYTPPPADILDSAFARSLGFGQWRFSMDNDVAGLGRQPCLFPENYRECNDVIAFVPYISEAACRLIDASERIVISATEPIPGLNPSGIVNLSGYAGIVSGQQKIAEVFFGRMSGCFRMDKICCSATAPAIVEVAPAYTYFRVLAVR